MRLTSARLAGILHACAEVLGPQIWQRGAAALFLYGSRADDTKRGGDIDLLLFGNSECLAELKRKKRALLTGIEKNIGECRIDLTIAPLATAQQSEFVKSVLPTAVQLYP